jgi:hypothetical protein
MIDEAFELKAIEYAIRILQKKKDGKHAQELDYAVNVLRERKEQIMAGKEEKIGVA